MIELFAKVETNQTPRSAASDLGLHCLPATLLGVSRLHWIVMHRLCMYVGLRCLRLLTIPLYKVSFKRLVFIAASEVKEKGSARGGVYINFLISAQKHRL